MRPGADTERESEGGAETGGGNKAGAKAVWTPANQEEPVEAEYELLTEGRPPAPALASGGDAPGQG